MHAVKGICFLKGEKKKALKLANRWFSTHRKMLIKRHDMHTLYACDKKVKTCNSCYSVTEKVVMTLIIEESFCLSSFFTKKATATITLKKFWTLKGLRNDSGLIFHLV